MKAVWALRAKESKSKVAAYIRKEFGNQRAKKFRQDLNNTISIALE